MKEAAGTTKAINLSSNVAAFVTFVIHGKIIYTLGLAAAICSILGNYIGSGLVMGNGQKRKMDPQLISGKLRWENSSCLKIFSKISN